MDASLLMHNIIHSLLNGYEVHEVARTFSFGRQGWISDGTEPKQIHTFLCAHIKSHLPLIWLFFFAFFPLECRRWFPHGPDQYKDGSWPKRKTNPRKSKCVMSNQHNTLHTGLCVRTIGTKTMAHKYKGTPRCFKYYFHVPLLLLLLAIKANGLRLPLQTLHI